MTKYQQGEKFESMQELLSAYLARKPIYWRGKYLAYGFYQNWTLHMLEAAIKRGVAHCARPKDE